MAMEIANEILRQLGGAGRLGAMINAKNFVGGEDYLQFRMMKGKNGINMARIRLNGADLYDVDFFKVRGINCEQVAGCRGYYVDMLADAFRDEAGLAIRL